MGARSGTMLGVPGTTVDGTTTGGVAVEPDGGSVTTSPPNGLRPSVGSDPSAFTRATLSAIASGTGSSAGRPDGCGRAAVRGGFGVGDGFGATGRVRTIFGAAMGVASPGPRRSSRAVRPVSATLQKYAAAPAAASSERARMGVPGMRI